MAVNVNRVILAGNLTRDPEMRFTPAGTAVTNLGLAVNRQYTTKEGEQRKEVCFITVVTWGKQAQSCQEHLRKGSPVLVEGRLQFRSWESADKEKRSMIEVVAERVQFLSRREEEGGGTVGEENSGYESAEETKEQEG
ncbi:MAG: single-stranded DNA-binding protein [Candidatus Omnitrophota bacterium]